MHELQFWGNKGIRLVFAGLASTSSCAKARLEVFFVRSRIPEEFALRMNPVRKFAIYAMGYK